MAESGALRDDGSRRAARGKATVRRQLRVVAGAATGDDMDRLIHERVRLAIVSSLAVEEPLSFNELKQLLGVTDGNLSVHARRLEDAGYIACEKSFSGRTPRTEYRLTAAGREALERYLAHMEALIHATRND